MTPEIWLWIQKQDIGRSPRYAFSMAYDSASKKTILFGGISLNGEFFNDTWEWEDQLWTQVADMGPSRAGHSMDYDSDRAKMVLFGGLDANGYKNDTWEWDGNEWIQIADTGPSPRLGHSMDYDSDRSKMVLFGGADDTSPKGDTWEWDGNEWIQIADTGPSNRVFHSMTYDSSEKEILLFGGYDTSATPEVIFGDTWKMKDNVWVKAQDMGPGPLYYVDMVYTGSRAVLFGGYNNIDVSHDTWDWKGSLWAQRQNIGPSGRAFHSMAYDRDRNRVVLFGGIDPGRGFNDTWELTIKHT